MAANTANFTLPPGQWQAEGLADSAELQRLQQQLMAVQQAQMDPGGAIGTPGGGAALNLNPVILKLRETMLEKKLDAAKKSQLDFQGRYLDAQNQAGRDYTAARDGVPKELQGPTMDEQPLMSGPMGGNRRAYLKFESSPFPQVAKAAGEDRKTYEAEYKQGVDKATLASMQDAGGDLNKLQAKPEFKVVDGAMVRVPESGNPTLAPGSGYAQETDPQGNRVNRNLLSNKVETVNRAPVVNNNMPGSKIVDEKIKELTTSQAAAKSAAEILRSTETALDAMREGGQSGTGSDILQAARTATTLITGIKFDASTPTAVLAKTLASNVMAEFGGKLGNGVSNADVSFMEKAAGGTSTDPGAIDRILAIRAAAALNKIREHNKDTEILSQSAQPANSSFAPEDIMKLYTVQQPKFNFQFSTPDANASFESGVGNRPLSQTKSELKQLGEQAPAGKNWREDPKERQRRLDQIMKGG